MLCIFAAPSWAADEDARGIVRGTTGPEFTGIAIDRADQRKPVQNGGYALDRRSASADVFVPGTQRNVLRPLGSGYSPVTIKIPN